MGEQNAPRTQSRIRAPHALDRVRQVVAKDKGVRFTALFHHVDIERLRTAYLALKRDAAPRVVRLIRKWLAAGVMENGTWAASEIGSPQGATASPLLANIYLHYALDLWAHQMENTGGAR